MADPVERLTFLRTPRTSREDVSQPVLRSSSRGSRTVILACLAIVAAIAVGAVSAIAWRTDDVLRPSIAPTSAPFTVQVTRIDLELRLTGTVVPTKTVSLLAPFDGQIKEKLFEYGEPVEAGQVLLVMDTGELEMKVRDAQAALLKASHTYAQLKNWPRSIEMSRSRRAVETAQFDVQDGRRRLQETRALLDRGIVPRQEYESVEQQLRTRESALATAVQEAAATLASGGEQAREIAELDFKNAEGRLTDLKQQLDRAILEATISGIVQRDDASARGPAQASIEPGRRLTRGQPILRLASIEGMQVRAKIDEVDVNQIKVGQNARITGDGFDGLQIDGRVEKVLEQSDAGERTGSPSFYALISLDPLDASARSKVRLGMSSSIAIQIYSNPNAIVLPPDAIGTEDGKPTVRVLKDNGEQLVRPISIGRPTVDGIEVLSGVIPGERISVGPSR